MSDTDNPITIHPEIVSGTPCFAGTRVPVTAMTDYLSDGENLETFLMDFPTVERHQVIAALELAGRLLAQNARRVVEPEAAAVGVGARP